MATSISRGGFFTDGRGGVGTPIVTINAGATYTTTTPIVETGNKRHITIMGKATGANASSSGDVTFTILARVNNVWSTSAFATHIVTVAGTAAKAAAPEVIAIYGIEALKVSQVVNGDASYAVGTVDLHFVMSD